MQRGAPSIVHFPAISLLKQDAIWTLIKRFLNVMNIRWTSIQRCVLTGFKHKEVVIRITELPFTK